MNFQDELKINAKTKQELDDEKQQAFNHSLQKEAVNCFSNIEEDMKHKVSNADCFT